MSKFIERLLLLQTEEQVAGWLWQSLLDLHSVNRQSELYRFMAAANDMESPEEALADIYYRCYCDKEMYRKAIGCALRRCAREPWAEVNQIVDDLIYLIGYIGAVEALDGLLALLSVVAGEHPEVLYACMANIQAIEPCGELFDFMAELVQGLYFDDSYIFSAIKIMVDCRPNSFIEIVDGLGRRISKLYKKVKERGADEESVYRETVAELFASNSEIMEKILFYSTEQKQSG